MLIKSCVSHINRNNDKKDRMKKIKACTDVTGLNKR